MIINIQGFFSKNIEIETIFKKTEINNELNVLF